MPYQLTVISQGETFRNSVVDMVAGNRDPELMIGQWSGGVLEFAGVAFPGVEIDNIFAKKHEREAEGRGPHFDIYQSYVNQALPWIGHYNLSGNASLRTAALPDDLAESYNKRYPRPSDAATEARRHYSKIALEDPRVEVGESTLVAGTRLILPVDSKGPHIIHEIIPMDPSNPGSFIKMVVPSKALKARKELVSAEYQSLDQFVTTALGGAIAAKSAKRISEQGSAVAAIRHAQAAPFGGFRAYDEPPRRRCNLD